MSFRTTISYILWPLSMWYGLGVAVRNMLYSIGLLKQVAPHVTTIGVGNLSTGGTGKTPHVEYLLRLLANHYSTAMLSRGYKRKSKGFQMDDGSYDATILGDEPAMIAAKHTTVRVAVCEDRLEGVKQLMALERVEQQGDDEVHISMAPQLIVLDDVFQHRRIKPSINILLTEYRHPFYSDHILPYGNLREFKSARYRAGIVVVTKCPSPMNPIERHNIVRDLRLMNFQKVFFSTLKYGKLLDRNGVEAEIDIRRMDRVLVVTGIAHPETLLEELQRHCKVQHIAFADHHEYTKRDVAHIADTFNAMPEQRKIIITTEKDAVRLRMVAADMQFFVLPVEVEFIKEKELDFDQMIVSSVKENISFLSKLSIWNV